MLCRLVCIVVILVGADYDVTAQNNTSEPCGIQSSENPFPWLVGIEYAPSYTLTPRIECTGALIDNRHVVSKANCFIGLSVRGTAKSVRLGPYNAITGDDCFGELYNNNCTDVGAIRIPIELIIPHPNYDDKEIFSHPAGNHYDIALVRLKRKAPYTELIRPICLPSADITMLTAAEQELYLTGLIFHFYNPSRKEKHHETATYNEKTDCEKVLDTVVGEDNICAKNPENQTSCLRPGGLLMNNKGDRFELTGLLEFKWSCANVKVLNNLYRQIAWIRSEIQKWLHGCGRRKVEHVELIISGESTRAGDWPWHTAIYRLNKYICGGTLISKSMVLTAAHCVTIGGVPASPEIFTIVLGKHYLVEKDSESQERLVHSVISHEEFAPKNHLNNDIALLKLKTEATYNDYVQPACIWSSEATDRLPNDSRFGTVVGWGFDQSDRLSSHLKQANMPKIVDATCISKNPLFYSKVLANNKKFCAGWANGTSTCNGDSGGGFLVFVPDTAKDDSPDAAGSWYIRGIVSLSAAIRNKGLCDPYQYAVFTDIFHYTNWIQRYLVNKLL